MAQAGFSTRPSSSSGALLALLVPVAAGLSLAVGWLAVEFEVNALLAVVGVLAGGIVLIRPVWGVYLLILTFPIENALEIGAGLTLSKVLGMAVFVMWFIHKIVRLESWKAVFSDKLLGVAFLFVVFASVSSLWADYPVSMQGMLTLFLMLGLIIIVIDVTTTWKQLDWILKFFLLGGLIAVVLTILQFMQGRFVPSFRAGGDISGGVNETATLLAILVPFAFYQVRVSARSVWRFIGVAYIVLVVPAIMVTFSRAGYLLLAVAFGIQCWILFRRRVRRRPGSKRRGLAYLLFMPVGIIGLVLLLRFVPLDLVEERFSTVGPYLETAYSGGTLGSRVAHMKIGYLIFRDHPLLGVGYNNFGYHFDDYQFDVLVPHFYFVNAGRRSPHSSFTGFMAELGIIGIMLWITLHLIAFRKMWSSRSFLGVKPQPVLQAMLVAIFVSFLLYTINGVVNISHNDKQFWLMLGMTAALWRLAVQYGKTLIPKGAKQR